MTKLHAGGKFGGEGYKVSGGLHGVGVSVVNALSEWLTVEVCREGYRYRQSYERGAPTSDLERIEPCSDYCGTTIHFRPDTRDLRRPQLQLQHPVAAAAGGGVPESFAPHLPGRRARRHRRGRRPAIWGRGGRRVQTARPRRHRGATRPSTGASVCNRAGPAGSGRRPDTTSPQAHGAAGGHLLLRRGHRRLRHAHQRAEGRHPSADRLFRRPGNRSHLRVCSHGRVGHAVERGLQRQRVLFRQQHQHSRGWYPSLGFQGGADPHDQRLRPLQRVSEREGREPQRGGRARGSSGHPQRQAPRAAVRRADQDQAGQLRDPWPCGRCGQPEVRRVPGGESLRRAPDHHQDGPGRARAHGCPQGPGPDPAQERAGEHHSAGQAGRLLHPRPGLVRVVSGGGRLGRRLGKAGSRPQLPGHPALAREDHQRGEGPAEQDPLQHRDPGHHKRLWHQPGRRVRPRRRPAITSSSS